MEENKAKYTEAQKQQLENVIKTQLEKAKDQGFLQGSKLVASVVLRHAKKKQPYNKRINSIISFCNTIIGNADKKAKDIGVNVNFE